ncbi:MAG: hypothetical protein D6743_15060, partial [Calditrichaeota bacterium]
MARHVVGALAILVLLSCAKKEQPSVTTTPPAVRVVRPVYRPRSLSFEAFGILQAGRRATLAFGTGGIIDSLPVFAGQRVDRGATLALLETTEFRARFEQAQARFNKARRDWLR